MGDEKTPMTVGELRAMLADLTDDTPVFVMADEFGIYYRPSVSHRVLYLSDRGAYGDPAWRDCYCEPDAACDHLKAVSLS